VATVRLERVTKVYPNGVEAVHELDLEVADGEFTVLVGPSGCGKTTALRMVAGLEDITSGEIYIGGSLVNDVLPKDRDIAMVFQNYALYPHMTVAQNIGFPLRMRKVPKEQVRAKVAEAASILGLTDQLNRKPGQLSGGQRQRVAMGRAIVRDPAVFLMDEPLSNLDAKLRVQMRTEILSLQKRLGVATLYVTHDQVEAMTMGNRVAVLNAGHLQQYDSPQTLYTRPANLFVATFMGSPPMNIYEAALSGDGCRIMIGSQALEFGAGLCEAHPRLAAYKGHKLALGIRPEHLMIEEAGTSDANRLVVDVESVETLGSEQLVHFRLDACSVQLSTGMAPTHEFEELAVTAPATGASTGVARVSSDVIVQTGHRMAFKVSADRLHFFDLESGQSVAG
jgi:multiple sugar transport system ATP-binding protein